MPSSFYSSVYHSIIMLIPIIFGLVEGQRNICSNPQKSYSTNLFMSFNLTQYPAGKKVNLKIRRTVSPRFVFDVC